MHHREGDSHHDGDTESVLIDERDPMDHPLMPGVDRDSADDRLFHHTPGTTRYIRNNAGVYRDFSRRASLRMMRGFDNAFRDVFMPHSPEFIRPIAGNTVGRELLRVETRQHDLDELTRLLA